MWYTFGFGPGVAYAALQAERNVFRGKTLHITQREDA